MIWLAVGCVGLVVFGGVVLLAWSKPWRDDVKNEAGDERSEPW